DLDRAPVPAPAPISQPAAMAPPEPPPGKNDYLAQARRAAQAQSLPKTRPEPGPTPQLSLRGSSRIVLWGAASGIALLLVGGAFFYSGNRPAPAPAEPRAGVQPNHVIEAPPPPAQDPLAATAPAQPDATGARPVQSGPLAAPAGGAP